MLLRGKCGGGGVGGELVVLIMFIIIYALVLLIDIHSNTHPTEMDDPPGWVGHGSPAYPYTPLCNQTTIGFTTYHDTSTFT